MIATDKGWNLYVCGNGGMKPRHADLFASDLDEATLIRSIDRLLMFYIRTADRLQRTSTWMDNLEGGVAYLRQVVLEDSLGIGEELEQEMARIVDSYQCEWQTTLNDPQRLALFRSFVNSDQPDEAVQRRDLRGQPQPLLTETLPEGELPSRPWQAVCDLDAIPAQAGIGARLGAADCPVPLRRAGLRPRQPRAGQRGQRAVAWAVRGRRRRAGGDLPLYKQRIRLRDGWPCDGDEQAVRAWPVKVENGKVWVGNQQLLARAEAS